MSEITAQVSDSIIVTDRKFKIIYVNKATERLYGYTQSELLGRTPGFLNAEPLAEGIQRKIYRAVLSGKVWTGRHLNRRKDRSHFMCEFKITPVKNSKGRIYCFCGLQADVTDKEEIRKILLAERDLGVQLGMVRDMKEALRYILETGLQIEGVDCGVIYLMNDKDRCLDLAVHKGLGAAFVEQVSHFNIKDEEFKMVMKRKPVFAPYLKILRDVSHHKREEHLKALAVVPIVYHKKVLAVIALGSHSVQNIPRRSRILVLALAERISGIVLRLKMEIEFKRNAFHDSLTNIPNRRLFIKNLTQSIKRAQRDAQHKFALLFLDLDRFKDINDGLGHLTGDKVILNISQKLQQCLRANDTIARFGGDEFTILLDDVGGLEDAIDAANRIQIILSQPFLIEGREFFITGSIGVLMYTDKYHSPDDMLRDADTAMYRAKLSGRARYAVFDEDMHAKAETRIQLIHDMRRAVPNKEFVVYYQPILSLVSGQISGVEALLRWHHPARGIIAPNDFIPLAEETGAIIPMTENVLRQASRQMRIWQERGRHLRFSLNLSVSNFTQGNLLELVERSLQENGLKADSIELEITENTAMKEFDLVLSVLHQFRALGGQISIDDFGVGYAPLVYLKQYPISRIKIDRSFIRDIMEDKNDMAITEAIIAMAHLLGIAVVAEGVETVEQMKFLRSRNCDEMQGFLFSPAVLPEKIDEFLKDNTSIAHLFT